MKEREKMDEFKNLKSKANLRDIKSSYMLKKIFFLWMKD